MEQVSFTKQAKLFLPWGKISSQTLPAQSTLILCFVGHCNFLWTWGEIFLGKALFLLFCNFSSCWFSPRKVKLYLSIVSADGLKSWSVTQEKPEQLPAFLGLGTSENKTQTIFLLAQNIQDEIKPWPLGLWRTFGIWWPWCTQSTREGKPLAKIWAFQGAE